MGRGRFYIKWSYIIYPIGIYIMARVKDPSHFIFYHCKVLTHVVLVVVLCALKAVLKLVIIFVHLVIARVYVLCHVV